MTLFDTSLPDSEVHAQWKAEQEEKRAHPAPLTPTAAFWAVFWALWAFAISAGVITAIFKFIVLMAPSGSM